MEPADSRDELLPCVDFTQTRRVLRRVYLVSLLGVGSAFGALGLLQTDVVVRGSAVVTPAGETARVQSARGGMVDEILVREGDRVQKGQPIVRFDRRPTRAKLETLAAEASAVAERIPLLEGLIESRAAVYGTQGKIGRVDRAGVAARRRAATELIAAREREREVRAREDVVAQKLFAANVVAKTDLDAAAIRAGNAVAEAESAQATLNGVETSRRRLDLELQLVKQDSAVATFADGAVLAQARADLARLQGEIAVAKLDEEFTEITAPRGGVVQDLAVLDRGDVVAPGATIASVVPGAEDVVVKATVATDGIAFIWPKQPVRIKLDAYPFQDFGVFRGEVQRVANDTAAESTRRRGPTYDVKVGVISSPRIVNGETLWLRPGMMGEAEFTVRREGILAALLRPLRGTVDSVRH